MPQHFKVRIMVQMSDTPTRNPKYSTREMVRVATGAGGSGLVLGLVASSFSVAGIVSMTVASVMLVVAWVIGVVSITVSEPVWGLPKGFRFIATLLSCLGLGGLLALVGWYQFNHFPFSDKGTARLTLSTVGPIKMPDTNNLSMFNISVANNGNAIAQNAAVIAAGKLADHQLSQPEIDADLKIIADLMERAEKAGPNKQQIPPTLGRTITLSDVNNLSSVIYATDSDINDFSQGKKWLYVFWLSRYEDDTISGRAFWKSEGCAGFYATFSYWHQCGPIQIERISRPRY